MIFEPISCNSLHACWPVVRKGLERILAKSKVGWIPEDVYAALRNGKAMLVFGREGPHVVGFFIVEQVAEPFDITKQYLNVWCLEAEEGALRFKEEAFAEIDPDCLLHLGRARCGRDVLDRDAVSPRRAGRGRG